MGSNGKLTFRSLHEKFLVYTNLDGPKLTGTAEKTSQESHLKECLNLVLNEDAGGAFCKLFQQLASWCERTMEDGIHSLHAVTCGECFLLLVFNVLLS